MRAVGYFAEGARRKGMKRSVGDQNRSFVEFCGRQGYEIAGTFLQTDDPGADESGFRQMLNFLQRADRGFTVVVVDSLGTLGPDLGRAAMKLLTIEATGVPVISAASGREAAKELVSTWADQGEATPVSERVRSAMRRKAVKGEVLGRPPYGYRVGPRRRLELVPEEAVVVRYIFRLYLQEGMGIRKIAGQLNEEGIPTRRGGRWSMVTIRDLLRNRAYLGTYTRFGVKVPGSHPALVSPDDFRRVQERLQSRTGGVRERKVQPFLLSGLVFCGRCGNKLIGVSRRQKWTTKAGDEHTGAYRYYQCETRTNQSACGYNTQRADELEARVRNLLAEDAAAVTRVHRAGNIDSYILGTLAEVDRIEGRMRKNRRQLEEIVSDAAHGHISVERMKSLGADIAADQHGLELQVQAARQRASVQQSEAERRRHLDDQKARLVRDWDTMDFDARQEVIREVVDRVEVDGADTKIFLRP